MNIEKPKKFDGTISGAKRHGGESQERVAMAEAVETEIAIFQEQINAFKRLVEERVDTIRSLEQAIRAHDGKTEYRDVLAYGREALANAVVDLKDVVRNLESVRDAIFLAHDAESIGEE